MLKTKIPFLILVVLLAACSSQPNSAGGIEVIVFSWDRPMMADIPEIHIWKDGHAVWVEYGTDDPLHVYETFLSEAEISQVQATLNNSGFWQDKDDGWISPGSSANTIWAKSTWKEKSEVVGVGDDTKYRDTVTSLRNILEASDQKTEYFPEGAYLFVKEDYMPGFEWPDKEVSFDFNKATQEIYINGKVLSTVWKAIQAKEAWIVSNNTSYLYDLRIPGLSCLYGYDRVKGNQLCEIYTAEVP